jgi:D-alanyl-D-alanine carboxypeptidase (penicillin-binding protein 5/6)
MKMLQELLQRPRKQIIITTSVVVAIILILAGALLWAKSVNGEEKNIETPQEVAPVFNPFEDVRISAKAAIVKDISTGKILYEKDPDESLPLASITKVLTAVTALDTLSEDDLIQVGPMVLTEGNDAGFVVGSNFRLKDMLKVSLVSSSNTAARALAISGGQKIATPGQDPLQAFLDRMNSVAKNIGMENSSFKNPTGLDENNETVASNFGSARDVARLFEYTLKNYQEILESTQETSLTVRSREGYAHKAVNTNNIVGELPNIIGSKTGYTDIAGGNLAVAIDPGLNTPVVIVVLGSSKEGRFKDVEILSKATLDYFLLKQ